MNKKKLLVLPILILIMCIGVYFVNNKTNETRGDYMITDINIYKDTEAWELALAVKGEEVKEIEKILREKPELVNYQDPKYGATLLLWSVGMEKYESAEALLKCGADPDIASTDDGKTPLYVAAGFSWIDNDFKKDPKYVKLLLNYGADPNKTYTATENNSMDRGESPLMNSIGCGIEKTKALVEGGADINYKQENGYTAAVSALGSFAGPEYAYYLVVEKKAKVNEPYVRSEEMTMRGDDPDEKLYPVDGLRQWVFDLNSEEYKMKMEIVAECERQGADYWSTPVPRNRLSQIKKLYPDSWEEYIKKY